MRRHLLALALSLLLPAAPILAQVAAPASLLADAVRLRADTALVAEGNVEVLYRGTRLRAARIVYDRAGDRLLIDGPITIEDGENSLILADAAELDDNLRNGILTGARLVLDQQLQLAASRIDRIDGRYTQLSNSVASSCEICAGNPTPTWEIRARRVIHDQLERQLYFDSATFRLLGVPIFYAPRLRLPDPTLDRARGFLLPRLRTTSQLGTGVKLPYFVPFGETADLTLTPYLSSGTRTLELRYRQAFATGALQLDGALSNDDQPSEDPRYYLFADGSFALARGFTLNLDVEQVSDSAYLLDYGYSERDRLQTELELVRARRKDSFRAALTDFRTLRDAEIPIADQLPDLYGVIGYERRVDVGRGELRFGLDAATLNRASDAPGAGRDVDRAAVAAEYLRAIPLRWGMLGQARAGFTASSYTTRDDPRFAPTTAQLTPHVVAELRWPLARAGTDGVRHLLEPVVQLAYSRTSGNTVPNEDSVLVEFDSGNLFSRSRFPGIDRIETGARANLGLGYTRTDPEGWTLGLTVGRVLRAEADPRFLPGTGLDARLSDWLTETRLDIGPGFSLSNRALIDDGLGITRNEARLTLDNGRASLDTTYVWLEASALENRPNDVQEVAFDGSWRFGESWTGIFDGRYDLASEQAARAGLGLEYRSQCLSVDFSLSRRFTSSTNVSPSTDFGLQLSLAGFGPNTNGTAGRRGCSG
ncbi:LPS-assembly protein LptD [Profundibacterium mesophilum]|uniref:LPS-assembly protein LptD n=1 Tax=Profundibacterium mesophilum KAUST100406-0324 TaxID=1037889 RepID=A0A921NPS6_9RHOB|nr:LPS assembly protein LptD [Profundibacterium mesophilum]KAF0674930.1 putative organic solvent tolerance protein [Profundibacterium mesophilum KAUST100406-0324]